MRTSIAASIGMRGARGAPYSAGAATCGGRAERAFTAGCAMRTSLAQSVSMRGARGAPYKCWYRIWLES